MAIDGVPIHGHCSCQYLLSQPLYMLLRLLPVCMCPSQLANMRRKLDELKGLHRAVSVSRSQLEQAALNFSQNPNDALLSPTAAAAGRDKLALQPVYIATDAAGGRHAVVPASKASPSSARQAVASDTVQHSKSMSSPSHHERSSSMMASSSTAYAKASPTSSAKPPVAPHSSRPAPRTVDVDLDSITASATDAVLKQLTASNPSKNARPGRVVADGGFAMNYDDLIRAAVMEAGQQ